MSGQLVSAASAWQACLQHDLALGKAIRILKSLIKSVNNSLQRVTAPHDIPAAVCRVTPLTGSCWPINWATFSSIATWPELGLNMPVAAHSVCLVVAVQLC